MTHLPPFLASFLERHLRSTLEGGGKVARPVLIGPPHAVLRELYDELTADGSRDWQVGDADVAVLLVEPNPPPSGGGGASQRCGWDYAVSVRNSRPVAVLLVSPRSWDTMPESLANTTEVLGSPSLRPGRAALRDAVWIPAIEAAAQRTGALRRDVGTALRRLARNVEPLGPPTSDTAAWEALDQLLGPPGPLDPKQKIAAACGFACPSSDTSIPAAAGAFQSLGSLFERYGWAESLEKLGDSPTVVDEGLGGAVEEMVVWLRARTSSSSELGRAPHWYFRQPEDPEPWWSALGADDVTQILLEVNEKPQPVRLEVLNPLVPGPEKRPGEPTCTGTTTRLRVVDREGTPRPDANVRRRVGRGERETLAVAANATVEDAPPPPHQAPVKYEAEAPGTRAATLSVLCLDTFDCGGMARSDDAVRVGVPKLDKKRGAWRQELRLPRAGRQRWTVLHGSAVSTVAWRAGGEGQPQEIEVAGHQSEIEVEVDDGSEVEISTSTGDGDVASWVVDVVVEASGTTAPSRYEALVLYHGARSGGLAVPEADGSPLRGLEQDYLAEPGSWRPVVAGWSHASASSGVIDWDSGALGDVAPTLDPRPLIGSPPTDVLAAREALRSLLAETGRPLVEARIGDASRALVEAYLELYAAWYESAPEAACWMDCIAVYDVVENTQARQPETSPEPTAILLSPLHPLRIGWQAEAQRRLDGSMGARCPLVGVLDPDAAPDAGAWYLPVGDGTPRAYVSVMSGDPYWGLMWNGTALDKRLERARVSSRLRALGFDTGGVEGGFDTKQARDSVQEVSRLSPARSTLRIGVVGTDESSSEAAEGIIQWCEAELDGSVLSPSAVEVYDERGQHELALSPRPERLAELSEQTGERVRWFWQGPGAGSVLDLSIIDQLGAGSLALSDGGPAAAMSDGALTRVRVREEQEEGGLILESRVGTPPPSSSPASLGRLVRNLAVAFESSAAGDQGATRFAFRPNRAAIESRLDQATFLAVTSEQVDAATIVRGAASSGGYLWDYELPASMGGGEGGAGYFLVAKPQDAMRRSIRNAVTLVSDTAPSADDLLDEISRRGIPILKRLAGGGTAAKGELGMLLAVRLIQDAFRDGGSGGPLIPLGGDRVHLLLPVDVYQEPLDRARKSLLGDTSPAKRADLLVIAIDTAAPRVVMRMTPVEVKFRSGTMQPGDVRDALDQATMLSTLLRELWVTPPRSDLWETCSRSLLAQMLDLTFRVYADASVHGSDSVRWADVHGTVLRSVLDGTVALDVDPAGRVVVFDERDATWAADMDQDGQVDTLVVDRADARALLDGDEPSAASRNGVEALGLSLPGLPPGPASPPISPVPSPAPLDAGGHSPRPAGPAGTSADSPQADSPQAEDETGSPSPEPTTLAPFPAESRHIGPEIRSQVSAAFEGFVGNRRSVRRLSTYLLRALSETPPHLSKNILLTGPPSTGKTELAKRMAAALDLPFVRLDGRGVDSRERLIELVDGELDRLGIPVEEVGQMADLPVRSYPPLTVFVDEIHLVKGGVQESLLTLLEAGDRAVTLKESVAQLERATFLFATTRPSALDGAFRTRCTEVQLREYTDEEVADIVEGRMDAGWPRDAYVELARLGRGVPRIALDLANELETTMLVAEAPGASLRDHLREVQDTLEIDDLGLTPLDRRYLSVLEREGKPAGETRIANLLGVADRNRLTDEVEPLLRRLGFIAFGGAGRELTAAGREYVLGKRMDRSQDP